MTFVLSAHHLEHLANPFKALEEWQCVLSPSGTLSLVLPNYRETFNHLREPTKVDHMLDDFVQNVGKDDFHASSGIVDKHDLSMDLAASSEAEFKKRCLENFIDQCLHHHVFDEQNNRELLTPGWV